MSSGYKIISFRGVSLSAVPVTIKGLHAEIEGNNKATLLTDIVIENVEKDDRFTAFTVDSGSFVADIENGIITITADDAVTFTNN